MHSCLKKTSEAMFDWMATTALKTFFERITILTESTFRGVLFYASILNWCNWHSCCDFSRLQMWLQPDEVSCLKTLINTILSTFTDIQELFLGCLFLFKNQEFPWKFPWDFPESFFEIPKSNFTDCLINSIICIYIHFCYLFIVMSKSFWHSFFFSLNINNTLVSGKTTIQLFV